MRQAYHWQFLERLRAVEYVRSYAEGESHLLRRHGGHVGLGDYTQIGTANLQFITLLPATPCCSRTTTPC
jgi:hypothetical protein